MAAITLFSVFIFLSFVALVLTRVQMNRPTPVAAPVVAPAVVSSSSRPTTSRITRNQPMQRLPTNRV